MTRYAHPAVLAALPPDRHAVIEASAGTGKTYTIEHLVVDRLLRGVCTVDQLLVVTFTEKATAELRRRVRALLEVILRAQGETTGEHTWVVDEPARRRLEAALFGFDRAAIHTIHAFCNRVLADLAFASGQPFELHIADGEAAFRRAFRACLRTELAVEPGCRALLDEWLRGRDADALSGLLLSAHKAGHLGAARDLEGHLERLEAHLDLSGLRREYQESRIVKAAAAEAGGALEAVAAALAAGGSAADRAQRIAEAVGEGGARLLAPRRSSSKRKRRFPEELTRPAKAFLDALRGVLLLNAQADTLERRIADTFLPRVVARLEADKARDGSLDFDDLLGRVHAALHGPHGEALCAALRERYRHALIDEFQDTDGRQWDIFRRLFLDPGASGRLVVVGDPKQAIYGFRGADVRTYLAAREELLARGAARVPLDVCYRSSGAVVDGYNAVLDQRASHPLFVGDIRYDRPVTCGRGDPTEGPAEGVVVWRYKPEPPRGARNRVELPVYELREAFCAQLGRTIRGLLDHPFRWKGEPIGPADIFVLVRSGPEAREVVEALQEAGVPVAAWRADGLLRSKEAREVHDLLAAVAEPGSRRARLAAFATPFFDVPLEALPACWELPPQHPLPGRLYRWKSEADRGGLAALLGRLLEESGLLERLRFAGGEARAVTNYRHVLELLTEEVARARRPLPELVSLLDRWIHGLDRPEGRDADTQRRPGAEDAVQVMTIHKAKGLEAPVVCLYGGFRPPPGDPVQVVHASGARHVLLGEAGREYAKQALETESAEEDQRLYYVALTRACARLYVPFVDSSRRIKGSYRILNERLRAMDAEGALDFETVQVAPAERGRPAYRIHTGAPLGRWTPPSPPPVGTAVSPELRARSAPLVVTSYTRMKSEAEKEAPLDADEFRHDLAGEADPDDLPGGREVGRFLHEAIEGLALDGLGAPFEAWRADPGVEEVFTEAMRRHGVERRWLDRSQRLVFDALTCAAPMPGGHRAPLWRCAPHVVEMELLFPLPEAGHALLSGQGEGFRVERGFVKGFVDLVFTHRGRTCFADWKSDVLPAYDAASLVPHVEAHYGLQAELYTLGLCRLLRIADEAAYEARFGGLLYVFLRGVDEEGGGVYAARPTWAEVQASERALLP